MNLSLLRRREQPTDPTRLVGLDADPTEADPTEAESIPTPVESTPIGPALVDPTLVDPTLVDPTPVEPRPVESTPIDRPQSSRLPAGRPDSTAVLSTPTGPDSTRNRATRPDSAPADPIESGRDWVVDLGLTAAGGGAVAASYSALKGLAHLTGWGHLDWLLWVCIDIYGLTATRVWLSRRTQSRKVRRFAAYNAVGAIALSLAGNAAYHAIHANAWDLGGHFWVLVVAVSSVPPTIIGFIGHLAVLRTRDTDFAELESIRTPADSTRPRLDSTAARSTQLDSAPVDRTDPDSTPVDSTRLDRDSTEKSTDRESTDGESTDRESADRRRVDSSRNRPADESTGDQLTPELIQKARELNQKRLDAEGKKATAEYLRTELHISPPKARRLRDLVTNVHAVQDQSDPGEEKTT